MRPPVVQGRPSTKEEDVSRDLSQLYCLSKAEKDKRTVFWLPASDEQILLNESTLRTGVNTVVPNGDFYAAFPDYWQKSKPTANH